MVLWAPPLVMLVALCLLAGIGGMELQRCVSGAPRSELVGMSAIFPVFMAVSYTHLDVYKRQPTENDLIMHHWFRESGCPEIIVANKLDKLKKSQVCLLYTSRCV